MRFATLFTLGAGVVATSASFEVARRSSSCADACSGPSCEGANLNSSYTTCVTGNCNATQSATILSFALGDCINVVNSPSNSTSPATSSTSSSSPGIFAASKKKAAAARYGASFALTGFGAVLSLVALAL